MKKGWKIFWIICGSMFGLGLVLCISGKAMGVTLEGIAKAYINDIHIKKSLIYKHNDWDYNDDYDDYDDSNNIRTGGSGVSNFSGIRELDVNVEALQVIVRQGDGDDILVDKSHMDKRLQDKLEIEQEEGELSIESTDGHLFNRLSEEHTDKLIIEIPKKSVIEDASFKIGTGKLAIEALNAGSLDIDVGAGEVRVDQFEAKDLDVDCGAGYADLKGSITGNSEIHCGVGKINMKLAQNQNDYDYELKCGIGTLKVGNDNYTGIGRKKFIDNGTRRNMKFDCGVGEVAVSFKDTK